MIRKTVKRICFAVLPVEVIYDIRRRRRQRRHGASGDTYIPDYSVRNDVTRLSVNDDMFIEVFWKDIPTATGPAFSFFAHGEEVLRLDCGGPGRGHYHASFLAREHTRHNRNHFFEDTREMQVSRARFELQNNIGYYLERHPWRKIRKITLNEDQWARVCSDAEQLARNFLHTVPELIEAEREA